MQLRRLREPLVGSCLVLFACYRESSSPQVVSLKRSSPQSGSDLPVFGASYRGLIRISYPLPIQRRVSVIRACPVPPADSSVVAAHHSRLESLPVGARRAAVVKPYRVRPYRADPQARRCVSAAKLAARTRRGVNPNHSLG